MPSAEIHVTLKPSLFDAQGATVLKALHQLGHLEVQSARIGKFITLQIEGLDGAQLQSNLDQMCQQLLANPVIEDYEITLAEHLAATAAMPTVAVTPSTFPTAAKGTSVPPTVGATTGTDAFSLDYTTYQAMSTDSKMGLRSLALQKHGDWIRKQLRERRAAWILCVGQDVIEAGDSIETYPSEAQVHQLGSQRNLVPWVFTRPPGGA